MLNGAGQATLQLLPDNTVLNEGTEEELKCYGYRESGCKRCLFYFLVVITLGLVFLLLYWKPELECYLKKSRCVLYRADTVLLMDRYEQKYVCTIKSLNIADELSEFNDAYNREESGPENSLDHSDMATLTVKQFEPVVLYFDFQHVRYIWSSRSKTYSKLLDLSSNTLMTSLENHKALTRLQQAHRRMLYGNNSVEVEVKSYWKLLIEEVLNPFYIFQLFSIVLWTTDQYYVYALCILVISLISIIISLYQTKRQMVTLHNMVKTDATTISVDRGDSCYETIPVTDLVPGDIIAVPSQGCTMTCDAVVLQGSVIVNESMLTGESLPVTKTAIAVHDQQEVYSPTEHKRNTVFAGTKVLQTRFYGGRKVPAVVIRTGFNTAKGELVRAILFPKPLGFKFYRDAMRFIMFLAVVACFGMAYSVYTHVVLLHASARRIVLRVLDVVTIIVPPALPAAMTVGTVYAQNRLKKKQIFCISPPRINFCGRLNLFCFDKTGTLTEDGMDLGKVLPVVDSRFLHSVSDPSLLDRNNLLIGLATCHSLTIIDGEISGDPMDIVMFKSTKWMLEEPGSDTSKFDNIMPTIVKPVTRETFMPEEDLGEATNFEVGIVHQFPFSNKLKRMSVITRTFGKSNMDVFCKGAPEVVMKICDNKTVPDDTDEIMMQYAIQGFRVMALAGKPLDPKVTWHQVQRMSRDDAESGLTFLGLLIFQNKLKPQSKPVIRTLRSAGIRTVMITGDRSETAVSVGRNCGMIDSRDHVVVVKASKSEEGRPASICWEALEGAHTESPDLSSDPDSEHGGVQFSNYKYSAAKKVTTRVPMEEPKTHLAIDGYSLSVLEEHFPETLRKVCVRGTIFSRMSPDQKCLLIQKFQELGYSVGMCGDGANDCEALKAAHAGISLSEAEASVAAPFTSAINNIECVTTLMREGRAALVTSFGCFKYMALYSFIQFISVMILYTYEFSLSDWQFLYIDLAITTTIAILMGYTEAYERLVSHRPEGSLLKPTNILSILLQVSCAALFQAAALFYLIEQPWYVEQKPRNDADTQSWVSTVVFIVSSYQYIVVAFCFSKGPPFRKRIYTNVPYLSSLIFLTILSTCIFMIPIEFLLKIFKMEDLGEHNLQFRLVLLAIVGGHFLASYIIEYFVTENLCVKSCIKSCLKCVQPKKLPAQYKLLEKEMEGSDWPPTGEETTNDRSPSFDLTLQQDGNFPLSINR
ncbi:polyamine-transporting ATPase 13A3-like isoform X2 [Mya arenaria]|uniref:polyamine-transporting ATPase 13A3-like isoform X2 n=1 Tax=Mya arenaria TaxID=6604 RepID=UPI0022E957C5|nr:polyamine-transporting ATPase 13A3-like isoform X2 [Mya arenaria]